MMNVGENRAQNGVLDSPESKNEEKLLSVGRLDPSRPFWLLVAATNNHKTPPKLTSEATRSHRSYQGSSLQVPIVILPAKLRLIRLNSIMELKVLISELYLVNPCVAEQKTLIVLLVDTPFAGRIASPLV
ncbi:hypothetical protein E3N88_14944 [Mikania micrantha]|uniref:Uncharacterized protein n=1 Tax=Mikania micrantha TaxID=192012 RepID=A0A5N6P2V8_9ASTR|nr:hypothetical protein E3N88_14944 [Mikania micrantha]